LKSASAMIKERTALIMAGGCWNSGALQND
jgi:hypothetical protein